MASIPCMFAQSLSAVCFVVGVGVYAFIPAAIAGAIFGADVLSVTPRRRPGVSGLLIAVLASCIFTLLPAWLLAEALSYYARNPHLFRIFFITGYVLTGVIATPVFCTAAPLLRLWHRPRGPRGCSVHGYRLDAATAGGGI